MTGPVVPLQPNDITITVHRNSEPVLVTGSPAVVRAVLDALAEVLEGAPRRRVLRLAREAESETGKPEGGP